MDGDWQKPEQHEPRWLGLRSYEERDSHLFFGRDEDADALMRMVRREVLSIVFAPSGTGKTSLLRAGLFPLLRSIGFLPIWIRLDHSVEADHYASQIKNMLEEAAAAEGLEITSIVEPQASPDEETFWEYMHRVEFWSDDNELVTPVVVIDQFEEVFTIGRNHPEAADFLIDLADVIQKRIPTQVRERLARENRKLSIPVDTQTFRFVLSLRQDFVPQLDSMRKSMPAVMRNRYPLRVMTGSQAMQAVLGPGDGIVSQGVARRIVEIVGGTAAGDPDNSPRELDNISVEPNHLSLVCHELDQSRMRDGKDRIAADKLKEQSQDILRRFYTESFVGLEPDAQVFVEENLLTSTGYRKSQPLDDAELNGLSRSSLKQLVDRHVLRIDDRQDISHVELTHDLLTGVVQESRNRRHDEEEKERLLTERRVESRRRRLYGAACGMLLLFLAIASFLAFRAIQAEQIAAEHADAADRNAASAEASRQATEQLLSYMTQDLYDRLRPIGRLDLLQEVAVKAQRHIEANAGNALAGERLIDQSRARNRVGNVLLLKGYLKTAIENQWQAIEMARGGVVSANGNNNELATFTLDYAE
ncbi:MAG: hypothetical protein AAF449_20745, partial [Myxococcota bacterium]